MLKILALILLAVCGLALYYQFMTEVMPMWLLVVSMVAGLVGAWAVAKTDRKGSAGLQAPISVGLIVVSLCVLLVVLTTIGIMSALLIISVVIGLLGAWWLWTGEWSAPAAPVSSATMASASSASESVSAASEKPAPAPAPEPAPAPAPKVEAKPEPKPAAPKAAPKKSSKKEAFTTDAPAPANLMTSAPPKSEIDDLKKVNGIGPVFEKLLHKNGVYQFEQLGAFTKKDVEWLSAQLNSFPDRIERKEWVKQAKALAKEKAKAAK